jgi:serine/threonine-protein kinase
VTQAPPVENEPAHPGVPIMVAARVILTVTNGNHRGMQFDIQGPGHCVIGRASDCFVRLAGAAEDWLVSRHHCQLDVGPPCVRVQDLGSCNGTFLNGNRLVRPECGPLSEHGSASIAQQYELKDGDELQVGIIPLRVTIPTEAEGPPAN